MSGWCYLGRVRRKAGASPGFDPDVVDPAGEWQAGPGWSRNRDDAIRLLSRGEAEACCHAAPADAPLRPDGTLIRPPSIYWVAFGYEPPGLPPVAQDVGHQCLLEQLGPDGAT
jgi:hypothetical protein